jgi:uncharacterized protein DUF937
MPGLHDLLTDAQDGNAMAMLGREFGLSPSQTEAAVTALLPAISAGLKRATATPEGLGKLFAVMGYQQDLGAMYDNPGVAFAQQGRAAGNDVLSAIFGTPEVSRAVVDQVRRFSGVGSSILKSMLPVIAGMILSGLLGGKSGKAAAPQAPSPSPAPGGGLGDILGQIFGRGEPSGSSPIPRQAPAPTGQPIPIPTDPGAQQVPGGDLLSQILLELQKGIQEGRIKPVIIGGGPMQIPMPGGQEGPVRIPVPGEPAPPRPGGDILGEILREVLGGGAGGPARMPQRPGQSPPIKDLSDRSRQLGVMGGAGEAVFGDRLEVGRDIEQEHLDSIQNVLDRFFGAQRR